MNQRKPEGGHHVPKFVAFDTLAYANKLKSAGENPKVAEAQAEATAKPLALGFLVFNAQIARD